MKEDARLRNEERSRQRTGSYMKDHKDMPCVRGIMNGHYLRFLTECQEFKLDPHTGVTFNYCPVCGEKL